MPGIFSQTGQTGKLARGRGTVSPHELHRRARGLSIAELAAAAGVDHSLVSRVERGERRPSVAYRVAISSVLGVPEAQLFPGTQLEATRAARAR